MTHFGIFLPARRATGDGRGCEAPVPSFFGWRRRERARSHVTPGWQTLDQRRSGSPRHMERGACALVAPPRAWKGSVGV